MSWSISMMDLYVGGSKYSKSCSNFETNTTGARERHRIKDPAKDARQHKDLLPFCCSRPAFMASSPAHAQHQHPLESISGKELNLKTLQTENFNESPLEPKGERVLSFLSPTPQHRLTTLRFIIRFIMISEVLRSKNMCFS